LPYVKIPPEPKEVETKLLLNVLAITVRETLI
jgi:hypothetical protein